MSKKQKIDPDYFLALTLQKKFNDEYKKEKNEKVKNKNGFFEPQPSCSDQDLASPARKKPMTDRPPFASPHRPLSFNKPTTSKPVSHPNSTSYAKPISSSPAKLSSSQSTSLNDSQWEVIDPTPDVHGLFVAFGRRFFQDRLGSVEVKWSKRMTSCAGVCRFKGRRDRFGRGIGEVTISLSEPLLKLRPRSDLVNTLLHEMIHAYLFLFTENPSRADRDDHGQEFQQHMHRINKEAGTRITIYHTFHDEVKLYKQHWWQCSGPCKSRGPFFGLVKRATNRAPGKYDFWFATHQAECGGEFIKIKEPDNFKARPRKNKENFGGQLMGGISQRAIGGPSTSSGGSIGGTTGPSNIRGFGHPNNSNAKHLPTPGQPKIVGFVDLNRSPPGAPNQSKPLGNTVRPNAVVGKPGNTLGSSVGGYTLGTTGKMGGNKIGTPSGLKSGTPHDEFYKLGTPLNKTNRIRSPNRTLESPESVNKPNSCIRPTNSSQVPSSRSSNPIGSKLLDKLKFDSQVGNRNGSTSRGGFGSSSKGGVGSSTRGGIGSSNRGGMGSSPRGIGSSTRGGLGSSPRGGMGSSPRGGMGSSTRGGFSGGGATRMNKGSGTMVLNPTKSATTQPNETAERITKPINKTDENKLNLDLFKPFTGQGQTLGGGTAPDRTKSRLLATSNSGENAESSRYARDNSGSDRNYGSNSRDKSKNDRGSSSNSRDNSRSNRDNDRNIGDNSRNMRDNNRNIRDNDSISSNARDSNNKKMCLGNRSLYSSEASTSHSNNQSSQSNSSGSRSSPHNNRDHSRDHLKWELGDEEMADDYEYKKINSSFSKDNNHGANLDDSCVEMEKMMNDTDVDVFDGITDETLSQLSGGLAGNDGETSTGIHESEHNDSLDDIFEISSEEDPDDETHCPVCSQPIARARMNQHLENCMELSQVFDNVAIDEDDDEIDENGDDVFNKNNQMAGDNANNNDRLRNEICKRQENIDFKKTNEEMVTNANDSVLDDDIAIMNAKRFARIAGCHNSAQANDVTMKNADENAESRDNDTSGVDGSKVVKCPICNADIREACANEHIDECLARNMSQEMD